MTCCSPCASENVHSSVTFWNRWLPLQVYTMDARGILYKTSGSNVHFIKTRRCGTSLAEGKGWSDQDDGHVSALIGMLGSRDSWHVRLQRWACSGTDKLNLHSNEPPTSRLQSHQTFMSQSVSPRHSFHSNVWRYSV